MSVYDLSVTDALLSTTRSVRKRLDFERPVPDAIVRECLELSMQAPNGSNRQGWRWVVVTDVKKRRALGEIYRKGASTYIENGLREAQEAGNKQEVRVYESARYLYGRLQDAPVHVLPCIELLDGLNENPDLWWPSMMASIVPAVWSFQLALRARGLGSTLTTLHLSCAAEAAALLGIPDNIKQVALLPVAYTIGTDFKPAKRRPLDDILHWNGW